MKNIVSVNPFECRMWDLHDRIEANVNEESCKEEIESFLKHGQLIPALGRPLSKNDPTHRVELIYGARRLFVSRHLNIPLLVELRELTDREAIVAMDIENRHRCDISPYERGLSYTRWLRSGHFKAQEDVAKALRVSASQVSRLLKLAQMPSIVVDAFDSSASIREVWGLEIMQVLEDTGRRAATIRAARNLASLTPRLPAHQVYRQLISASVQGRRVRQPTHDEVVKDVTGRPLFRIRHQRSTVALVLPLEKLAPDVFAAVRNAVAAALQTGSVLVERQIERPQNGALSPNNLGSRVA